jgi:hypothetical protein
MTNRKQLCKQQGPECDKLAEEPGTTRLGSSVATNSEGVVSKSKTQHDRTADNSLIDYISLRWILLSLISPLAVVLGRLYSHRMMFAPITNRRVLDLHAATCRPGIGISLVNYPPRVVNIDLCSLCQ